MTNSKRAYTDFLNAQYADMDEQTYLDLFVYVTNRERGKFCCPLHAFEAYRRNNTVGRMIRKYDPTLFETEYYYWKEHS